MNNLDNRNKTKIKIAILIILVVVAGYYIYQNKKTYTIVGCYVAHLEKDVYTINIQSQQTTNVKGTLSYKNFEKDSSAGTFEGTFINNILLGDYSFTSEGMDSVSQVVFRKDGNQFYQGFGPIQMVNDRSVFVNPSAVEFNTAWPFEKTDECGK